MSASEIIAMIEKLPPSEKAEVYAFIEKQTHSAPPPPGFLPQAEAEGIAARVFQDHDALFRKLAQ